MLKPKIHLRTQNYSADPKREQVLREIARLERMIVDLQGKMGGQNENILDTYKEMIQNRKDLLHVLQNMSFH